MLKRILLSGAALAVLTSVAMAQAPAPADPSPPAAQPGATSPAPQSGMAATQSQNDPNLFSNIKGADVVGQNDEEVGSLVDILLQPDGTMTHVVIGHGGIIGIGQTYRLHQAAELPAVQDGKAKMGALSTAALEGLPKYEYSQAETGRAATEGAPAGGMAKSGDTASSAPAASATSQDWPASSLVGANITNAKDSAEIKDLRFEGNRVAAVLIDKGSLGLGNDVAEVAFNDLAISGTPAKPEIALKSSAAGVAVDPSKGDAAGSPSAAPAAPAAPAK